MRTIASALFAVVSATSAAEQAQANPIRRVVILLQGMAEKIEAEGKRQEKAMQKYVCYCKNNKAELATSISDGKATIELLKSKIEAAGNAKTQAAADLKQAQVDREEAQKANADAQSAREKEAAEFAEESGEMKANIDAMAKAIPAIENGMSGSFLQTVGRLAANSADLSPEDKDSVAAFLQSATGSTYEPASGQIVGILKQMKETMEADLAELTKQENDAISQFNGLQSAKNQEISASTEAIEENMKQVGELGVGIVTMQGNLADTEDSLAADEGYLAELEKGCDSMQADYEQIKKERSEELAAVADTINILNDDDALELFKKTVPSSETSLLQVRASSKVVREQALAAIASARGASHNPSLDLISLALRSKKTSFEAVEKMIDNMADVLKKEGMDDETKKEYCHNELHNSEQQKKELQHTLMTLSNEIQDHKDNLERLRAQVAELEEGIKNLDKAVQDATEQRKDEHDEYVQEAAENQGALQVLEFAKNRLNKFYNPKEYKEPPKRELTEEERIYSAYGGDIGTTPPPGGIANTGIMAFVQVHSHIDSADVAKPPPPPKVGGFKKQNASKGVMGMIDMIVQDLKTEMQEAEFAEKQAQEDYEKLMTDSGEKRAADVKSISAREGAIAEREQDLQQGQDTSGAKMNELQETMQYTAGVHKSCDFLLENIEKRKEARQQETDGLRKSKELLEGADLSFMQTGHFLAHK
jgi:chromosome segregation ATPase